MDLRKQSTYTTLVEGYGAFSIYGALQGNTSRRVLQNDQCWCQDIDKSFPKGGQCYPEVLCNSCDLNRTGSCPQGSGSDPVPGVS